MMSDHAGLLKPRTLLLASLLVTASFAQPGGDPNNQRGDNPRAKPIPAEEQLKLFHVPPGFEMQLVAADPQLGKPMNLAFDTAGRIWVTCSELYPFPARADANGQPIADFGYYWNKADTRFRLGATAPQAAERGLDRVLILSDFGPDGRARNTDELRGRAQHSHRRAAAAALAGIRGDAALVFTAFPSIWRLTITDGDGRPMSARRSDRCSATRTRTA